MNRATFNFILFRSILAFRNVISEKSVLYCIVAIKIDVFLINLPKSFEMNEITHYYVGRPVKCFFCLLSFVKYNLTTFADAITDSNYHRGISHLTLF